LKIESKGRRSIDSRVRDLVSRERVRVRVREEGVDM